MRLAIATSFGLLIWLATPACAAKHDNNPLSTHSIHLIALPYLHAMHEDMHEDRGGPFISIDRYQYHEDLSIGQWRITLTSIPAYNSQSGALRTIDIDQSAEPALAFNQQLIIALPLPPGPVTVDPITVNHIGRRPLWLQMINLGAQKQAWHAPALTPAAAALALAEQKRKASLAKRMADRAFYFGYDTNKNALK